MIVPLLYYLMVGMLPTLLAILLIRRVFNEKETLAKAKASPNGVTGDLETTKGPFQSADRDRTIQIHQQCHTDLTFRIARRTRLDDFISKCGYITIWKSGHVEIDKALTITCYRKEENMGAIRNPELLSSLVALFQEQCCLNSIESSYSTLIASCTIQDPTHQLTKIYGPIKEALESMNLALSKTQPTISAGKPATLKAARIVILVVLLGAAAALFQRIMGPRPGQLLNDSMLRSGFWLPAFISSTIGLLIAILSWKNELAWQRGLKSITLTVGIAFLGVSGWIYSANMLLDDSPHSVRVGRIVALTPTFRGSGTKITLQPTSGKAEPIQLVVTEKEAAELMKGDFMELQVRSGYFDYPWISSWKRRQKPTAEY